MLVYVGPVLITGLLLLYVYSDRAPVITTHRSTFTFAEPPAQPFHEDSHSSKPFLDILCVYPLMESEETAGSPYSHVSRSDLLKRQREYVYCLRRNVQNPLVASVHLLSHRPQQLYDKLRHEYGVEMTKVFIHDTSDNPTYRKLFEFASEFFQRRFVMIVNADNYLGDSFESLDLGYLRENKVMYALTRRYPVPMPEGCHYPIASYCEKNSWYQDSHDAFLFFVHSPFSNDFLQAVDFASNTYGSENVVIWAFKSILNFSVLNPCRLLRIHHFHCSQVRPRDRPWVDKPETHGQANFTDSLYAYV